MAVVIKLVKQESLINRQEEVNHDYSFITPIMCHTLVEVQDTIKTTLHIFK